MISAYKPMTRLAVIGSALTVAALACVFLTGAADKTTPPTSTDAAKAQVTEPNSGKEQQDAKLRFDRHGTPIDAVTFAHQRKLLRHEFEKLSATVQQQSQKVDRLKEELQISDLEEAAFEKPDSEPLRRLESLRMDATADYQAINTLYVTLTNLSRAELLRALPTASPDALLQELLSRQSAAEQAQAEGIQKYGADHPENKMRQRALNEIVTQIDERADAVLYGIKTRIAAQKATLDHLQTEFVKAKEYQIARTIRQRPYFQAKRDLQTLEAARDRLHERLLQTEVDAALAPAGSAR